MTPLDEVLERARNLGLLGPGSFRAHARHAEAYLPAIADVTGCVADLGTGGGVPALVLAVHRSDLRWVLVETNRRRAAHLHWAVAHLSLGSRVEVRVARAEELGHDPEARACFDAVTARSFAGPAITAECASPLLREGGRLVLSEPPGGRLWPADELELLGLRRISEDGAPIVILERRGPIADALPRSWRAMTRSPRF